VATISGNVVTIIGIGTVTISATQSPTGNYAASATLSTILTVKPRPVVGEFAPITVKFAAAAPVITAPTSTSTGAWTYSSAQPTVINFINGVIQIVGAGVATITAKQASTATLSPITKSFTITVQPIAPEIKVPETITLIYSTTPTLLAGISSNSSGAYSYSSMNAIVATIANGQVTMGKAGESIITVNQAASGNYSAGVLAFNLVIKPYIKVAATGRVITVGFAGGSAKVYINGKLGYLGKNKVKAGTNVVRIVSGGTNVYSRSFRIK
jgi:hypothetical protein